MNLDNASSVACEIIDKSKHIFSNIEDLELFFNIQTIFGTEEIALSVVDKCCLCLFFAILDTSSDLKNIMGDFSISCEDALQMFNLDNSVFDINTNNEKWSKCDKKINLIVDGIDSNFVFLSEENLLKGLLSSKFCGSDLVSMVIADILRAHSFDSIESFEVFLNRMATKKDNEYLEKNPHVKRQNRVSNNNNSSSFFGFSGFINQPKEVGVYLTDKKYDYNPVINREKEMRKLMISLLTIDESPLLIGKPGVGKSILVEGLAYLIQNDLVPSELKNKKILMVNASDLVRGCGMVGSLEERVQSLIEKVESDKNTILFIDEIHTVMGAGASMNSNLDVANILKPYLSSGKIKMIGATTKDEFLKYIVNDGAFDRRFEIVEIFEPSQKQLVDIINGSISNYEQITGVKFPFENQDKDKILSSIIEVTNSNCRKDSTKSSNPALSLEILKRTFAYSKFHNRDEVQISDVVDAIMDNDRIYESVRQRHTSKLQSYFNSYKDKHKSLNKVIQFNDYLNKKGTF